MIPSATRNVVGTIVELESDGTGVQVDGAQTGPGDEVVTIENNGEAGQYPTRVGRFSDADLGVLGVYLALPGVGLLHETEGGCSVIGNYYEGDYTTLWAPGCALQETGPVCFYLLRLGDIGSGRGMILDGCEEVISIDPVQMLRQEASKHPTIWLHNVFIDSSCCVANEDVAFEVCTGSASSSRRARPWFMRRYVVDLSIIRRWRALEDQPWTVP